MINPKDPHFLLDEQINELHAFIKAMKVEKLFLINDKDLFDCYSINFDCHGGTITYCDWHGPMQHFTSNNTDELINHYVHLIKEHKSRD